MGSPPSIGNSCCSRAKIAVRKFSNNGKLSIHHASLEGRLKTELADFSAK